MKVVLLQDVKGTGKKDDVVEVADGYARNYMLPRKIAIVASSSALNAVNIKNEAKAHHKAIELEDAEQLAKKLSGMTFTIKGKAGGGERLFGSVTAKEIAETIKTQTGCEIDKRKILLDKDIKTFGDYDVTVKLYSGVSAAIKITVCE
ncbi:MAG: 50S ribosomal protein L9 [Oscillospiraceae bacterium]